MLMKFFRKKGLSSLSAFTLFFVGLCIIPCGVLKEVHAGSSNEQVISASKEADKMASHSCHESTPSATENISLDNTSSCPHCKGDIPVIMQEAKIKYISPELPLKLAHWQLDAFSTTQKYQLPEDDPPPGNQKNSIHILHSIFII